MRAHRQSIILLLALFGIGLLEPRPTAEHQEPARTSDAEPGRITMEAFMRMHDMKAVLVLDVRGTDAYRAGHIPGAVHVPLDQIGPRAEEIRSLAKPPHPIVTYCSCPEEHASLVAVRVLEENGILNASALIGGYPAWVEKGGKVDRKSKAPDPKDQ